MLIIPSRITSTELHDAIAAAFDWDVEHCTSWLSNMVDQDTSTVTNRDDPKQLEPIFTAYCAALE